MRMDDIPQDEMISDAETRAPKPGVRTDMLLPASIVIAAVLISGAWIYTSGSKTPSSAPQTDTNQAAHVGQSGNGANVIVPPMSSADHILGNPDASVTIIEYSDLECPYCKLFQSTLTQVMKEYGDSGKVAWVYRHYPIAGLHPKASHEAEASECANELGGNDAFWKYIDKVFAVTPSNNGLDPERLPKIAADIGLDEAKFVACLESGRYTQMIAREAKDAENAGGRGTPYSILIGKNGVKYPIEGAVSYDEIKSAIDALLR